MWLIILSVFVTITLWYLLCFEETVSLTMIPMEREKRHYFSYHSDSCKNDKILHQKHESFTFELPLIKLS